MADYGSYGGRSNNDRMSISTSMFTLWDEAGNQLRLSCLDNGLSLAIWVPYFSPDGRRQYPVEQRYSTLCSAKAVQTLEDIIKTTILPAYEAGRNEKRGIFTNAAHSNLIEVEVKDGSFFINFHRGCDAMTHIPQHTTQFKFDIYHIVTKFDQGSGEMEIEPVQADFYVFAKAISAFNDLVAGSIAAHGTRMLNSYNNARYMEYLKAIANQVHAQLPAPVNSYGNQSRTGMYGQNSQMPDSGVGGGMPSETEVTEVGSITDLM